MSPRTPFIYPPAAGGGAPAIEWTQLRLADGATPVDPGGMLRVPITDTDGLWEVDYLNDSGGTVNFVSTGDVVRIDFGALTDLSFPTGPSVTLVVQFYDIEFVSRYFVQPHVTLSMATTPPVSGNFQSCGAGFRLSSGGNEVVTDPRVSPASITGGTGAAVVLGGGEVLKVQGHASARLPTGRAGAWCVNDTVRVTTSVAFDYTRSRLILLLGGAVNASDTHAAKFRFRCRYAVIDLLEDYPA